MFTIDQLPFHIYVFAGILGLLAISFLLFFFLPSLLVSFRLSRIIKALRGLEGKPSNDMPSIFANSGVLEHLWQEYADSLHRQSDARWRSTVPANLMFPHETIIDTPLRTDFFKHLPGLFTGVGIIGTFYGLIMGLQAFQVSENPAIVRESLNHLLHGVWEAFLVSAIAISLAMVITFIEKAAVTRLNAQVEQLTQLLDSLFEGGASEEYLARLVKATEASSGQTASLLRNEMQQMMSDMFEKQMAASSAQSEALGKQMASTL
ncbi:MAG: MotA/TolQ/ExbB proton channel family protein, partial [Sideroxydans sp.]|nr:MotA/TolQ/ExbB proton channel family protein [Sideroxydans sp.]